METEKTAEEIAASLDHQSIIKLVGSHQELLTQNEKLQEQINWFKRQLFGPKSERRLLEPNALQMSLGDVFSMNSTESKTIKVPEHNRQIKKKSSSADDSELRFDESVPIEEILIPNPDLDLDGSVVVSEKITYRLGQKPAAFVVLKYTRQVVKRKDGALSCPGAPDSVLGKSLADVSLLAGLVIDKMAYHLPLYRQHQRMKAAGIRLARSTLTGLVHRTADLLTPIYRAQMESILQSEVLAMDETPIKAGRKKRGRMNTAYFWPVYGDKDEIVFPFSPSRGHAMVPEVLGDYSGILISDGYGAYERYAAQVNGVTHAQCWSHTRRKFIKAEGVEQSLASRALDLIGSLYHEEAEFRRKGVAGPKLIEKRADLCRPIVEEFFSWLEEELKTRVLLPSNPFTQAAGYALDRKKELRVFLSFANVPLDTNHLEREIRPIAIGRKNWMFAWTEIGAKYLGILQSLLVTCRLQGVDPYTYLVDVLQRISDHPAAKVEMLIPRLWKDNFADDPLRSDIDRVVKNADS